MSKLFETISASMPPDGVTITEWNATTKEMFTPFFGNSKDIESNIEHLRIELRNLARIFDFPEYIDLLHWTLGLYRAEIGSNRQDACAFLASNIHLSEKSDSAWFSLFQTNQQLPPDASLYDTVFQIFSTIDSVLEGCYKPHFEFLYSFAAKADSGQFPQLNRRLDFGSMKAKFSVSHSPKAKLYLADPLFKIGINQWRNIGAHKTFKVLSENNIELQYGMKVPPNMTSISLAQLRETLSWIFRIHTVARMASLIVYLENMVDIKPLISLLPNVRLEQSLTGLCHDLELVGFTCISLDKNERKVTLSLRCTSQKDQREAVIHASQILDQLATAVEFDHLMYGNYERCAVKVYSEVNEYIGRAEVKCSDAIEWTKGMYSMEDYVSLVEFQIGDAST